MLVPSGVNMTSLTSRHCGRAVPRARKELVPTPDTCRTVERGRHDRGAVRLNPTPFTWFDARRGHCRERAGFGRQDAAAVVRARGREQIAPFGYHATSRTSAPVPRVGAAGCRRGLPDHRHVVAAAGRDERSRGENAAMTMSPGWSRRARRCPQFATSKTRTSRAIVRSAPPAGSKETPLDRERMREPRARDAGRRRSRLAPPPPRRLPTQLPVRRDRQVADRRRRGRSCRAGRPVRVSHRPTMPSLRPRHEEGAVRPARRRRSPCRLQ